MARSMVGRGVVNGKRGHRHEGIAGRARGARAFQSSFALSRAQLPDRSPAGLARDRGQRVEATAVGGYQSCTRTAGPKCRARRRRVGPVGRGKRNRWISFAQSVLGWRAAARTWTRWSSLDQVARGSAQEAIGGRDGDARSRCVGAARGEVVKGPTTNRKMRGPKIVPNEGRD